jgi:hypothetical protein
MRLTPLIASCALGCATLVAQDVYPITRPATPMGKQVAPPVKGVEGPEGRQADPGIPSAANHFLLNDEYMITLEAYKAGSGYGRVYIAKMVTPATRETKDEAEFFVINSDKKGEKVWTKYFALTVPASREDLKLGAIAYALDANRDDDIYVGPKEREDNLGSTWFVGTINDTSSLYKGYLMLSGYKVKPSALRIAKPKG